MEILNLTLPDDAKILPYNLNDREMDMWQRMYVVEREQYIPASRNIDRHAQAVTMADKMILALRERCGRDPHEQDLNRGAV